GKVVVFTEPATIEVRTNFGTRQMQAPGNYTAAADAGAAGLLVIMTPQANAFRSRTGLMPTVANGIPGAAIAPSAAARLFSQPIEGLAVGTTGASIDARWSYDLTPLEYPTRNVLGILPGSDPKLRGQFVVIGAHNDHVGMVRGSV
ncbi:MAG: hypothetical protein KC489_05735, partial [Gemmatimonadetes bacterium]|nr:hypothetical protein [Gemmatimonadota bacterium]